MSDYKNSDLESVASRASTLVHNSMPRLAPVTSRINDDYRMGQSRRGQRVSGARRLEQIPSIQLPAPVAPRARLPGEFRTLSYVFKLNLRARSYEG